MRHLIRLALLAAPSLALAAAPPALQLRTAAPPDSIDAGVRVVHFVPGQGPDTADGLTARGQQVVSFLPPAAFLVIGSGPVADLAPVVAVEGWGSGRALTPELRRAVAKSAEDPGRRHAAVVGFATADGARDAAVDLEDAGAEVTWLATGATVPQLGLRVPARRLPSVIAVLDRRSDLVWADLQGGLRATNNNSAWRVQSGPARTTPIFDHGIRGEGEVIAIADSGIDIDACFFHDPAGLPALNGSTGTEVDPDHRKVRAVDFYWEEDWPDPQPWSWDSHGHGSHVAGSAAGDANADGRFDGIDGLAPSAHLVIQDGGFAPDDCTDFPGFGCPVHPYEPLLQQAWDQGARIHSNSYGDEENTTPFNRYTERTADMDRFVWEHKELVIVAAAGNNGVGEDNVISPSTGKNVLSVGATWLGSFDPPCPAPFSSRGWAHDGRIKPDVMAPGSQKVSAGTDFDIRTFNCFGAQLGGTSMATPTVAGAAALVRQYFRQGFWPSGTSTAGDGFEPTSALVRAVLVASAQDIAAQGCPIAEPIPSRDQGWGLVQLDRALMFDDSDFRLLIQDHRDGFTSSADRPWTAAVHHDGHGPLKVVLTWTDPPSSSAAAVNLVNDLDLVVRGPDGTRLGNAFADGVSIIGGTADRLNTTEVVWLPSAPAGSWLVEVRPHAVHLAPQDFALVVTGSVEPLAPRSPSPTRVGP